MLAWLLDVWFLYNEPSDCVVIGESHLADFT